MDKRPTVKRDIAPVKLTVTVTASKVNENGTFSSLVVESVKGPNKTCKTAIPYQMGGAIYLKTETLEGLNFLDSPAKEAATEKKKLF